MNKEEIIRIAKKASGDDWGIFKDFMPEIERFAALVAAVEREECAHICDHIAIGNATGEGYDAAFDCGFKIRARGSNV